MHTFNAPNNKLLYLLDTVDIFNKFPHFFYLFQNFCHSFFLFLKNTEINKRVNL